MPNVESAADPALPANEIEWRRSAYIYTESGIGRVQHIAAPQPLSACEASSKNWSKIAIHEKSESYIHFSSPNTSSLYSKSQSK